MQIVSMTYHNDNNSWLYQPYFDRYETELYTGEKGCLEHERSTLNLHILHTSKVESCVLI